MGIMGDAGWSDADLDLVAARVAGVVRGMARDGWAGRSLPDVTSELVRRLDRAAVGCPPDMVEPLARHVRDPHWARKHPWQALGLGFRYHAARDGRR